MKRPWILWLGVAIAYAAFFAWYTGSGTPLAPDEIDRYIGRLAADGRDPERLAEFRELLEADAGDDLVIVNAVAFYDTPLQVGEVAPGESSPEVLGRYMAYMWPALLVRACHPVILGDASTSIEVWGVEDARHWSMAGLMRYRSLRDLMEVATDPAFADAHQYKVAAMQRTISFPIAPALNLGEPRLLVALILFSLAAALQLLLGRR